MQRKLGTVSNKKRKDIAIHKASVPDTQGMVCGAQCI